MKIAESVMRGEAKWFCGPALGYDISWWIEDAGIHHYNHPSCLYGRMEFKKAINKPRRVRIKYMKKFPKLHCVDF